MARQLGQRICKTATLMGCSRSALVSLYKNCLIKEKDSDQPKCTDKRAKEVPIAEKVNAEKNTQTGYKGE